MAEELSRKDRIRKQAEIDAAASFTAGSIAAAQSAVRKAAHEAYNDPVAVGRRMEQEAGGLDPRAQDAIDFLSEGEPEVEGRDAELAVLHKAVRNRMREEAGLTGGTGASGKAAEAEKNDLDQYVPPAPPHGQQGHMECLPASRTRPVAVPATTSS